MWNLVEEKILNVEDIDKVISEGLGMRYAFLGALETAHLNAEGKIVILLIYNLFSIV